MGSTTLTLVTDIATKQVEFGDYQTPADFAMRVAQCLATRYDLKPSAIIEPTFGVGRFLQAGLATFPNVQALYGIEINAAYCSSARHITAEHAPQHTRVELHHEDFFDFDFRKIKAQISRNEPLLILGNPPWAMNSKLAAMQSANLPQKRNLKGHCGLDAMTGKGNFDIAEAIALRLLSEFREHACWLALLIKTSVAANIVRDAETVLNRSIAADMFVFNAAQIFGVACEACLFVVKPHAVAQSRCAVYNFDAPERLVRTFGYRSGRFYSNLTDETNGAQIDGECQLEWRQGIKHDCARVMELEPVEPHVYRNGLGQLCHFPTADNIYPLLKSSDIKSRVIRTSRRRVIVTQSKVGEDTAPLEHTNPALWKYLQQHDELMSARKSVIYKKAPPYAMFGVGDYSFKPYKVGISGFYREPIFALICGDTPIMMDDTCYFLSFDNYKKALIVAALLNTDTCVNFLKSVAFVDSKRPYTKEVLRRIDLRALANTVGYQAVAEFQSQTSHNTRVVTRKDFAEFVALLPTALFSW